MGIERANSTLNTGRMSGALQPKSRVRGSVDDIKGGEILAKGRAGTYPHQGWGTRSVIDFQGDQTSRVRDFL